MCKKKKTNPQNKTKQDHKTNLWDPSTVRQEELLSEYEMPWTRCWGRKRSMERDGTVKLKNSICLNNHYPFYFSTLLFLLWHIQSYWKESSGIRKETLFPRILVFLAVFLPLLCPISSRQSYPPSTATMTLSPHCCGKGCNQLCLAARCSMPRNPTLGVSRSKSWETPQGTNWHGRPLLISPVT